MIGIIVFNNKAFKVEIEEIHESVIKTSMCGKFIVKEKIKELENISNNEDEITLKTIEFGIIDTWKIKYLFINKLTKTKAEVIFGRAIRCYNL